MYTTRLRLRSTLKAGEKWVMPLMPVKQPPDLSKFLLCPMPGQVVRIDVEKGTIEKVAALAALMPIVASMGGIAGTQTVTLIIRGRAPGPSPR